MACGKIPTDPVRQTVVGSISAIGVTDHAKLSGREKENQHPIEAIVGLKEKLNEKINREAVQGIISEALKYKAKGLYYDTTIDS